jgi:mRNA interferase MazF
MAGFVKGDVVVIPFPFSDLSGTKKDQHLFWRTCPGNDIILCQITGQNVKDSFAIPLALNDFSCVSLPVTSNVRPTRIFTADKYYHSKRWKS